MKKQTGIKRRKRQIRQYYGVIGALLLTLIALLWPSSTQDNYVRAGKGDGIDAEITKVEDMDAVFDFLATRKATPEVSLTTDAENLFTTCAQTIEYDTVSEFPFRQHTSLSCTEDTDIRESDSDYTVRFKRKLQLHMTTTATYYVSEGLITVHTSGYSENPVDLKGQWDMEIYIASDLGMVKFTSFRWAQSISGVADAAEVSPEYLGKWIKMPSEVAQAFLEDIESYNQDVVSWLRGYIDDVKAGKTSFAQNGNQYTLKADTYTGKDADVLFDLSNSDAPFVEFWLETNDSEGSTYIYDAIRFQNIDNTVIQVHSTPDVFVANLDDIMLGEWN